MSHVINTLEKLHISLRDSGDVVAQGVFGSQASRPHNSNSAMLDDDIVTDSRIHTRPAQIVETKLANRLAAPRRAYFKR